MEATPANLFNDEFELDELDDASKLCFHKYLSGSALQRSKNKRGNY